MENPKGNPTFPNNTIAIFDRAKKAGNGSFVIARNANNEMTFKQLVYDAGVAYLMPLNLQFPPISIDDEVKYAVFYTLLLIAFK